MFQFLFPVKLSKIPSLENMWAKYLLIKSGVQWQEQEKNSVVKQLNSSVFSTINYYKHVANANVHCNYAIIELINVCCVCCFFPYLFEVWPQHVFYVELCSRFTLQMKAACISCCWFLLLSILLSYHIMLKPHFHTTLWKLNWRKKIVWVDVKQRKQNVKWNMRPQFFRKLLFRFHFSRSKSLFIALLLSRFGFCYQKHSHCSNKSFHAIKYSSFVGKMNHHLIINYVLKRLSICNL